MPGPGGDEDPEDEVGMLVDRLAGGEPKACCVEEEVGDMGLRNGLLAAANVLGEVASAKEDESEPRRGTGTGSGAVDLLGSLL